jgi:deoxycytidine triphosphate deaminase
MPDSPQFAEELRRAIEVRALHLEEAARRLRGPLGNSRQTLRDALDLVEMCPAQVRDAFEYEWARNPDPTSRIQLLQPILRLMLYVSQIVDDHLSHGTRRELSHGLVEEIVQELRELGLSKYSPVVAHGPANNFETTYGDVAAAMFGPLATPATTSPSPSFFALFRVPRLEGSTVHWRPILLGHEVAHVAAKERDSVQAFDLASKFDHQAAQQALAPNADVTDVMALFGIAERWATELICDAHALNRYGPAGVASLAEYFMAIGAMQLESPSHPPADLRVRLMLDRIGPPTSGRLAAITAPWQDFVPVSPTFPKSWMQFLTDLFMAHSADLAACADEFPTATYDWAGRSEVTEVLADCIATGVPGRTLIPLPDGQWVAATKPDFINAAWLARVEGAGTPVADLCAKGLESLDFLTRWVAHGGSLPLDLLAPAPPVSTSDAPPVSDGATLAETELVDRLVRSDESALVLTPLLQAPKGAGIDLRLGNKFILFRRAGTASFDPLLEDEDPRSVQVYLELGWTETFVLHPNEMVLGATLEYMVLPSDLTAQVITRSSYGRLGLLSATAVQVHPRFHGCLTLELVNLSSLPLLLTPGERIAQLVLSRTSAVPAEVDEKYAYPTGPQFSKVRSDDEARVLRSFREPK